MSVGPFSCGTTNVQIADRASSNIVGDGNAPLTNGDMVPLSPGVPQQETSSPSPAPSGTPTPIPTVNPAPPPPTPTPTATPTSTPTPTPTVSLSSVSPSSGLTSGGTLVTVLGSGFQSSAQLFFGANPAASVSFVGSGELQAITPIHSAGSVDVVVQNSDGGSDTLLSGFTFNPTPSTGNLSVSGISPGSGPYWGGTRVTIGGSGFHSDAKVYIAGVLTPAVQFIDATQLQVRTLPYIQGIVDITVANPNGSSDTLLKGYTYDDGSSIRSWHVNNAPASNCMDGPGAPGTESQPFCLLSSANDTHSQGEAVLIHPGTYRESILPTIGGTATQDTVYAGLGPKEDIKILGSNEVTGWTQCDPNVDPCISTNVYYTDLPDSGARRCELYDQPLPGMGCSGAVDYWPGGHECQMLPTDCWEDGNRWYIRPSFEGIASHPGGNTHQAASDASWVMSPGESFYDYNTGRLYIWPFNSDSPANHTVECSARLTAPLDGRRAPSGDKVLKGYFTLANVTVMHSSRGAILMDRAHDVTITNSELAFNSGNGSCGANPATIYKGKSGVRANYRILGNKIHDQGSDKGPGINHGGHAGAGIVFYSIRDSIIADNEIYNTTLAVQIKSGFDPIYYENMTVRNNVIYRTDNVLKGKNKGAGIVFALAGPGSTFAGIIEENVIHDLGRAITVERDNKDLLIVHNTMWNTRGIRVGTYFSNPVQNLRIRNNLMAHLAKDPESSSSAFISLLKDSLPETRSDFNLFHITNDFFGITEPSLVYYCSFTASCPNKTDGGWKAGTGLDTHSIEADPLVNSQFHLQASSPAIDPARDPRTSESSFIPGYHCPESDDINPTQLGCRRWSGSAPDIGAFEFITP